MIIGGMLMVVAAQAALAEPPLRPWTALVGHCWEGPAPGNRGVDRHCFESVFGGEHIRDRHSVTVGGKEVYAGESLYSAKGAQVVFTYWNSLGGLGTGTATMSGREWRFIGTIHATPAAGEEPMSAVWKIGTDHYEVNAEGGPPRLFKRVD